MMTKEQHVLCSLWLAITLQSFEARALPWCRVYPISIREEHNTERSLQSKTAGIEICTDCMNLQLGRSHARNFMVIRKKMTTSRVLSLFQVTLLVTICWLGFWTGALVHLFIRYELDLDPNLSGLLRIKLKRWPDTPFTTKGFVDRQHVSRFVRLQRKPPPRRSLTFPTIY